MYNARTERRLVIKPGLPKGSQPVTLGAIHCVRLTKVKNENDAEVQIVSAPALSLEVCWRVRAERTNEVRGVVSHRPKSAAVQKRSECIFKQADNYWIVDGSGPGRG